VDKLDTEVDIVSAFTARCSNDVLCNFSVIGNAPPAFGVFEEIVIWGSKAALTIQNNDVYHWNASGKQRKVAKREMPKGSNPDVNFIAAVRGTEQLAAPAECGLPVIQLTEAIWESGETGQPARVEG